MSSVIPSGAINTGGATHDVTVGSSIGGYAFSLGTHGGHWLTIQETSVIPIHASSAGGATLDIGRFGSICRSAKPHGASCEDTEASAGPTHAGASAEILSGIADRGIAFSALSHGAKVIASIITFRSEIAVGFTHAGRAANAILMVSETIDLATFRTSKPDLCARFAFY